MPLDLRTDSFSPAQWQEYQQLKAQNAEKLPHGTIVDLAKAPGPLRLDLGCGKNKREGFTGVDVRPFPGVDVQCDLAQPDDRLPFAGQSQIYRRWPWEDSSVDEVHCSHMLEHVKREARPHFFNELFRVLKPGGKATFITPHWASCRAYGDVTHEWPPVSEFFWLYLDKGWREVNAPHNDEYTCDFVTTYGYSPAAWLVGRNPEYVQEALTKFKEAAQDMQSTCVKR